MECGDLSPLSPRADLSASVRLFTHRSLCSLTATSRLPKAATSRRTPEPEFAQLLILPQEVQSLQCRERLLPGLVMDDLPAPIKGSGNILFAVVEE